MREWLITLQRELTLELRTKTGLMGRVEEKSIIVFARNKQSAKNKVKFNKREGWGIVEIIDWTLESYKLHFAQIKWIMTH